jgi:copper chaperone CopZ
MEKLFANTYHIDVMTCGSCVLTVKRTLSGVLGIKAVTVDLEKKNAVITSSEEIDTNTFRRALNNTSHTISKLYKN